MGYAPAQNLMVMIIHPIEELLAQLEEFSSGGESPWVCHLLHLEKLRRQKGD